MDPMTIGLAVAAALTSLGWFKSCRTVNSHNENNQKLKTNLGERKKVEADVKQKNSTVGSEIEKAKKHNEEQEKELEKLKSDFQKLTKDNEEYKKRVEAIKSATA